MFILPVLRHFHAVADTNAVSNQTVHQTREDLGAWLVENGWALAYARYSKAYVEQQKRAEAVQAGIWQSRFQKPWAWRRVYKEKAG
jgi:endonuclease YncB( thermonuclease family)